MHHTENRCVHACVCMGGGGVHEGTWERTVFCWTRSVHLQHFCNMSWKTCHQNNWYDVPKISMQFFWRSCIQPWSQECGVLCTCKIIPPTIPEETINSHHYLWIILALFFKELKEKMYGYFMQDNAMAYTTSSMTGLEDVFTKQVTTCTVWSPRSTDLKLCNNYYLWGTLWGPNRPILSSPLAFCIWLSSPPKSFVFAGLFSSMFYQQPHPQITSPTGFVTTSFTTQSFYLCSLLFLDCPWIW
jgi:hypothetical protein